jgi:hypothetical protein
MMKFPEKPSKGEKFIASSGAGFKWNGEAWDLDSSDSSIAPGSYARVSASVEEVKEFLRSDEIETVFLLSDLPITGSLKVFLNGMLQKENYDYSVDRAKITFSYDIYPGSDIQCIYGRQTYVSVVNESPVEEPDGENDSYTLRNDPNVGTEQVFLNGMLQKLNYDYLINGRKIVFNFSPPKGSVIICNYKF